ncbi:MAG TPA: DMT family transporter [Burkholderiaceae bacterium]|nr:DMT family transporter [Burkholderiaceae bacterium]
MKANLYALGSIALWATLAALGVSLSHVPPFLLTGLSLLIGSVIALPLLRHDLNQWCVPISTLALGVYGLFGFHFLLFIALRHAPPVEANLVNYLWPLFMVVLAPMLLPDIRLRGAHVAAALLGFAGAAMAILGASSDTPGGSGGAITAGGWSWGYLLALASGLIWASYSLLTKRVKPFPTAAIGLFGLLSGLLSLLCHWLLEPAIQLSGNDWMLIVLMGLGPLGAAFFLWDKALKLGDARHIGILSYLTPLTSTMMLLAVTHRPLTWPIAVATMMIVGAAVWGLRSR